MGKGRVDETRSFQQETGQTTKPRRRRDEEQTHTAKLGQLAMEALAKTGGPGGRYVVIDGAKSR